MHIHLPVSAFIRLSIIAVVVMAIAGCASASGEERIATALVSNDEAVQMAAVALTTDEQNVMSLGEDALVLFYPCPGTVFNYNVQQWHVSYVALHIPESLEGVSMRVIRAGGESGLGITDVVNGTDEGGRILDEALSNSQTVDEIEKQANFDARCASATGGGETPAALVSSEAPCYDASGRIHEVPLPLTKMGEFIDVVIRGEVISRTVGDYARADGKSDRWTVHEVKVLETLKGAPGQTATVYSGSSCLEPSGEYYLLLEDRIGVEDGPADYVVSSQSVFRVVNGKITETDASKSQYEGALSSEFRDLLVAEVASSEASPTAEPGDSAVDNFLAQLDERSITGIAPLGYGRVEHCLNTAGRSYEVASGGRMHFFLYENVLAAQAAADNVPADADCGPIDWVVDMRYYRCGELIVFLTSKGTDVLNALADLCGQPFAVGQHRFPRGSDFEP